MELFADTLLDIAKELPNDVQRSVIGRGYRGTQDTIQKMREAVSWGKRWPKTRRIVSSLIQSCERKDWMCMVEAVFNHVQSMQYVFDPSGIEAIQGIDVTEDIRMGDCDDFSVDIATQLESIGIPCYFKVIKAKPGSDEFTHVYVVAQVPGVGKVPLDATMPNPAGWEAADGKLPSKLFPSSFEEMEIHGGGENGSMSGLAIVRNKPVARRLRGLPQELHQYGIGHWTEQEIASYHSSAFGSLPVGAFSYESEGLSGLDCVECDGTCGGGKVQESGLSGLGETEIELSLGSVMDGSAYNELREAKDASNQLSIQAGSLLNQARASGDQNAIAAAQQAVNAAGRERASLYKAINIYSQLANAVRTYSLGIYNPNQLSGLGVAPVIVYTLLAIAAVYTLTSAFATIMATWHGDVNAAKSYIQQATDALTAAGHALDNAGEGAKKATELAKTIAIASAVGAAVYIGFLLLRKRKQI